MSGEHTVILTPTARLARAEKQRQALARQAAGQRAWRSPEVLAFPSWIGRLREDWFLLADSAPVPISASQALVLWQQVIDRDVFIGEPRVAEMAAASWRLLHEYCIDSPNDWPELLLSEDSRHFRDWASRFVELCDRHGLIDEWRFAGRLRELIEAGQIPLPEAIDLQGFELEPTPLQRSILDAAEAAGTKIERNGHDERARTLDSVTVHQDEADELLAAASWARARLEDHPGQHIAIAVPGLRQRLGTVDRILRQVFDPAGFALDVRRDEPWHISLGPPLARWPLVADALGLLKIEPHQISQPEAAAVLRSPFLAGWDEEWSARAEAQARIIRHLPYRLHAGQLAWQAGQSGAKTLSSRLSEWELQRRGHRDRATPSKWVARFQEELKAIGFGRGRGLDSREYQVLQRFHDLLEEFSALDLVVDQPIPRTEALRRLGERAASTPFRERNPGAAVEVLGVEEALGSRFDALWITGLDHRSWPSPTRRDPFIPASLQGALPGARAEGALERARGELDGLLKAAPALAGSFSRGSNEEQRRLTPLLPDCRVDEAAATQSVTPAPMEPPAGDSLAPAHPGGEVRGGTSVLQRQSDCPFKAFAETRLGARNLTPPRPGLDALDRGSLVHKALEHFWRGLDNLNALRALDQQTLAQRIAAARGAALEDFGRHRPLALSEAERSIEARCLERSLAKWLAIELEREPFAVAALETPVDLTFGGLRLRGKLDRIDELEGGGAVVIDYKTGASGKNGWAPESRLADVQLPAYATCLEPRPAAITFARLRPDSMGFDGLAESDPGVPGLQVIGETKGRSKFSDVESWSSLVDAWREQLESLAAEFRAGRAEVQPRANQVCQYCHLHALCRIHERSVLHESAEEGE